MAFDCMKGAGKYWFDSSKRSMQSEKDIECLSGKLLNHLNQFLIQDWRFDLPASYFTITTLVLIVFIFISTWLYPNLIR